MSIRNENEITCAFGIRTKNGMGVVRESFGVSMVDGMLIVESIVKDGRRFRPGDWVERIASTHARFGSDHRLHYSSSVRPCIINGEKCLLIDPALQAKNPDIYEYIMQFVVSNCLIMHEVKWTKSCTA